MGRTACPLGPKHPARSPCPLRSGDLGRKTKERVFPSNGSRINPVKMHFKNRYPINGNKSNITNEAPRVIRYMLHANVRLDILWDRSQMRSRGVQQTKTVFMTYVRVHGV
mgnify:CR=1 FL=1